MLNVSILRGPTAVSASQGLLEMDTATVQVSFIQLPHNVMHFVRADINECLDTCFEENAECINTEGSFSCQCSPGFTRDGYNYTG